MRITLTVFVLLCGWSTLVSSFTYFNPYFKYVGYNHPPLYTASHNNYVNHVPVPSYNPYLSNPTYTQPLYESHQASPYDSHINALPTINILAEKPYDIEKSFTVVPMLVVPEDNLNMITNGHVTSVSKKKPILTIKTNNRDTIQCTPAVRIVLETPIVVYNLKTSIMFPSQMTILHENVRIPIRIGAVIAPIAQDAYVSEESPVSVTVVYAIPTKPIQVDYVNNDRDVIIDANSQSVTVENNSGETTPVVEDEDSELVNRNPPSAPAGIVQSTQPGQSHLEVFTNPKESSVLTALREESKKRL